MIELRFIKFDSNAYALVSDFNEGPLVGENLGEYISRARNGPQMARATSGETRGS